ncbi:MAG: alpha/beta hydrolase family esterase [Acidimicrobiales bacterium]
MTAIDAVTVGDPGHEREALVHVPVSATGDITVTSPLVVVFHGFDETPEEMIERAGWIDKADEAGFVVVHPRALGTPPQWHLPGDPIDDLGYIDAVIAATAARVCVDLNRVFATGFSQGGWMANVVGCAFGDSLAGIAPVSGGYEAGWTTTCEHGRGLPVVGFHAEADPVVPYAGGPLEIAPDLELIAAEEWAADWAELNTCASGPTEDLPADGAVRLSWSGCEAPVEFYRIVDGDHVWPGGSLDASAGPGSISATEVIWDFFAASPAG